MTNRTSTQLTLVDPTESKQGAQKARTTILSGLSQLFRKKNTCLSEMRIVELWKRLSQQDDEAKDLLHLLRCAECRNDVLALCDYEKKSESPGNASKPSLRCTAPAKRVPILQFPIPPMSRQAGHTECMTEMIRLQLIHAQEAKRATDHYESEIQRLGRSLDQIQKQNKALQEELLLERKRFETRTANHHDCVSAARDLVVRMLGGFPPATSRQSFMIPKMALDGIQQMLQAVADTFTLTVAEGVRVYASLRVRTGNSYVTLARAGAVDAAARAKNSQPLHERSAAVLALRRSFRSGECVIRTGHHAITWTPMKNDGRGEDESVLLGAVFSTKCVGHSAHYPLRLEWILGVAADRPEAFQDYNRPLMHCFNDLFGVILNILVRIPPDAWERRLSQKLPKGSANKTTESIPQANTGTALVVA